MLETLIRLIKIIISKKFSFEIYHLSSENILDGSIEVNCLNRIEFCIWVANVRPAAIELPWQTIESTLQVKNLEIKDQDFFLFTHLSIEILFKKFNTNNPNSSVWKLKNVLSILSSILDPPKTIREIITKMQIRKGFKGRTRPIRNNNSAIFLIKLFG